MRKSSGKITVIRHQRAAGASRRKRLEQPTFLASVNGNTGFATGPCAQRCPDSGICLRGK